MNERLPPWPCILAGVGVFVLAWMTMALGRIPGLPRIGRSAWMLICAALAVVSNSVDAQDALKHIGEPQSIDTFILLFSMMIIGQHVHGAGLTDMLGQRIANGPAWAFILKTMIGSAFLSAVLTNDATCVLLTPVIITQCLNRNLPTQPFVLAIATASNIGSSCTPIGNPPNIIIRGYSGIEFSTFVKRVFPSMLVALALDSFALVLLLRCWTGGSRAMCLQGEKATKLAAAESGSKDSAEMLMACATTEAGASNADAGVDAWVEGVRVQLPRPARASSWHLTASDPAPSQLAIGLRSYGKKNTPDPGSIPLNLEPGEPWLLTLGIQLIDNKRRRTVWVRVVLFVVAGMVSCMALGLLSTSFAALSAAVFLLAADGREARTTLASIDMEVLIFFAAMFVVVPALTNTGLPALAWNAVADLAVLSGPLGVIVTCVAIVILSNIAGNVPTVLLLRKAAFESEHPLSVEQETAWMALAWLSNMAGNLTPPGSVANAIAIDATVKAGGCAPTLAQFLLFSVPMTVLSIAVGMPLLLWLEE